MRSMKTCELRSTCIGCKFFAASRFVNFQIFRGEHFSALCMLMGTHSFQVLHVLGRTFAVGVQLSVGCEQGNAAASLHALRDD